MGRLIIKTRVLPIVLAAAAIVYFLYLYERPEGVRVGDMAPEFSLPSKTGVVTLDPLRGKVVLLNFWATWCPPCAHEMPSLEVLKKRMEGRNFELLAVSVDEGGWAAVGKFLERLPVTMTILLDEHGEVSARFGTYRLPETYLIDKQGRIVAKYEGPRDWTEAGIVAEIEKHL